MEVDQDKILFPSAVKGSPVLTQRSVSAELEKIYIHSREEMNFQIPWSVLECYHPESNTEEEMIKDDTADSWMIHGRNNLTHTFLNI